jgi:hypothetical protein
MPVDNADRNFPTANYPLCCCLTSTLIPTVIRSRDDTLTQKLKQEQNEIIQEMLAILKAIRLLSPSTGALVPFIHQIQQQECAELMQVLNPYMQVKGSSTACINTDMGFQPASSLACVTHIHSTNKKQRIELTIPSSSNRKHTDATNGVSLAFIKSQIQVPPAHLQINNFGNPFFGNATPSSSSRTSQHRSDREIHMDESIPQSRFDDEGSVVTTQPDAEVDEPPPAKKSKKVSAAPIGAKMIATVSTKLNHGKETESQRAARKEREKQTAKSANKSVKAGTKSSSNMNSKKSSSSTSWQGDFLDAFQSEINAGSKTSTMSEEFKRAMGTATSTGVGSMHAPSKSTPQNKLTVNQHTSTKTKETSAMKEQSHAR